MIQHGMTDQGQDFILSYIQATRRTIESLSSLAPEIEMAAGIWIKAIHGGGKVIFCGNGGSAADAQHLSAELMGRFLIDRKPLAAVSLTVDTSAPTAIGNGYGFDKVFSRQLRGIGHRSDVLFGMSTSGNSANVVDAFECARTLGIETIAMTGAGGGRLGEIADLLMEVPYTQTNHIQEAHIAIGHLIFAIVEKTLCSPRPKFFAAEWERGLAR